ncbi:GTP cyclohydrolase I FolE [Streptomyces sp. NPDC006012]|uniref:GTP cyclohydrolase I FolE n=1 Tax=Streptomyces sp. NPDC006012 TaxID=3364739 RepID=UPI0036900CF6
MDVVAARLLSSRETEVRTHGTVDLTRIEGAVRDILLAVGEDPDRNGLKETPKRVAHAYAELFAGLRVDPADVLGTTFEEGHQELIMVCGIEVQSFCEHHLLPFMGRADIAYVPGTSGCVVGLSKLARLVEIYARRPQVQERLTAQIADCLYAALDAAGVMVVIECEHSCMTMRGIRKAGARTVTSAVRGTLQSDPRTRNEAMQLLRRTAA